MSRRLLRLEAELGNTFPVWEETPDEESGPLDPETSGLSEQLIQDLIAWNSQGEELLYSDTPIDENDYDYDYEKALIQWKKEGRSLAKRIEIELGKEIDVHVTYQL